MACDMVEDLHNVWHVGALASDGSNLLLEAYSHDLFKGFGLVISRSMAFHPAPQEVYVVWILYDS